ncbi:hypothetical protein ACP275_08G216500 [Erythranthe tilingii]
MSSRSSTSNRKQQTGSDSGDWSARPFPIEAHTCKCGIELPINTSWTDKNPGRRFLACANYMKVSHCNYFEWVDPEMCVRSKQIIPGLLKKLNKLEDDMKEEKENQGKMLIQLELYKKKVMKLMVVILALLLFIAMHMILKL